MTIKQQGGIFGRNPTFNNVEVDGEATLSSAKITDLTNNRIVVVGAGGEIEDDANLSWDGSQFNVSNGTVTLFATQGSSANAMRIGVGGNVSAVLEHRGYAGQNFLIQDETVASITAAGNLAFTSGRGIDFSATSGTGTSELFDDYEEGTWTPVLYGTTTAGTQTYTWQRGTYTKIGNRVIADFTILIGTKDATTSGQLEISGLPFTVNVNAGIPQAAFAFRSNMALQTNAYYHTAQPKINTAVIALGQAGSTVVNTGDNDFANGSQMIGSVQYYV